ncbi:uncharacterized protein SOCE836_028040 [Sorangium cellulosum]|uniref:Transposase n=1 Tax=Sorangium cellulosum TaxID=56 RepID=A0A4P2QMF2_SORCE|nr:uncharacterized protein SOCE836_028040 [Sorangium cellulosum]WCQ90081.1 hypothetical protein NQZ70_02782 [Sorangium sp. Soce836]
MRRFVGSYSSLLALREGVRGYQIAVQGLVCAKARLKALYRSRGIRGPGEAMVEAVTRASSLERLPVAHWVPGEQRSEQLDAAAIARERAEAWLLSAAHNLRWPGR